MAHDPLLYRDTAAYYVVGRAAYSRPLPETLLDAIDNAGRLLDVGCGPGVLCVELAGHFREAIGLDPDADMLAAGARRADVAGVGNVRWIQAVAEQIPDLNLGTFQLVTFGQSFHWTDRERVADAVYERLAPGGALAIVNHVFKGRPSGLFWDWPGDTEIQLAVKGR